MLAYGMEAVLPPSRVHNGAFLLVVLEALEAEEHVTRNDCQHWQTIKVMADRVVLPALRDIQSLGEAEAFLIRVCPQLAKKEIRLALEWVFLLLARHGQVEADLERFRPWLTLWRRVQAFHTIEQGFLVDFIRWACEKGFSPRSLVDILREYQKLRHWMADKEIQGLSAIGNVALSRYLLDRACGQSNAAKQKILGSLRSVFHYYKEVINGGYVVPDVTVSAPRILGVNQSASSEEVEWLFDALEAGQLPAMAGLMLTLVLGYGLPLKSLPLLCLTDQPGRLVYSDRRPSRGGMGECEMTLDLTLPWLKHYWSGVTTSRTKGYLFISGHGGRRKRPVSGEYCQRAVQVAVNHVLGYPLPVNYLERGALKRLARQNTLLHFMVATSELPKSRLARMMYWLVQN
ncbi:MAG: hypothetical protein AB7P76_12490 [Candidatus Melainabacteria bacterium]